MTKIRTLLIVFVIASVLASLAMAQTMTTGEIVGVVSDQTDAVVPGAAVTLRNAGTGETRAVTADGLGNFRLSFLTPGNYILSARKEGLTTDSVRVTVMVGQSQQIKILAKPQTVQQTVEVSSTAFIVQTENANLTTNFSTQQLRELPNPGNDLTTVAFTLPGVVVSTGAGYGNFSSNGLPGTANLFTIDGSDNMDPYLNLNNTGATNLSLGSSGVAEVAVVQNAYTAQYGRQAGAQVNFVTKSGSNEFHGMAEYNWNGAKLNANDFFNNASDTPRGRAVSNQFGANVGGRIIRDKTFFFANYEGFRYVLPTANTVTFPSQALQDYVLKQITPAQQGLYKQAFGLWSGAPGANRAVRVVNGGGILQDSSETMGCGGLAGTPDGKGGVFGETVSCANAFNSTVGSMNTEWLLQFKIDHQLTSKQHMFFRYKTDKGVQATTTDPINATFSATSPQPSWEAVVKHSYVISPTVVNDFSASASWYKAVFSPTDLPAAIQLLPLQLRLWDGGTNGSGGFTDLGVAGGSFPQGRRVGQFGIVEDLSIVKGAHAIKAGLNVRRNRISDLNPLILSEVPRYTFYTMNEFVAGQIDPTTGSSYQRRFAPFSVAHLRFLNIGWYAQDEWNVAKNFKLTFGIRFEQTSNIKCVDNCFARMVSPFDTLQKGVDIPYNKSIQTGLGEAFANFQSLVPLPRVSLVWNPKGGSGTVIRGGFGLFSDLAAGTLASATFQNAPNIFTPAVRFGSVAVSGPGSSAEGAVVTNAAFRSGFANGYTRAQIKAAIAPVAFTEPGFTSLPDNVLQPKYAEWNLEIQQPVGQKNVFTLGYVGNRGYDLFIQNAKVNAAAGGAYAGFGGLPATAPDLRFRIVTSYSNTAISRYNGLQFSYRRALGYGFQGEFGYTWSHGLDDISNGGTGSYFSSADSFTSQLIASNLHAGNYGSSDYDIRHNVTAHWVWDMPFKFSSSIAQKVVGGWTLSSKWYARTGTPFSINNSKIPGALSNSTGGAILTYATSAVPSSCGTSAVDTACFTASQFAAASKQTTWGNTGRNAFRAPGYFNSDLSLLKNISFTEKLKLMVGANVFNLFNHTNFRSPSHDVGTAGLGLINSTVTAPTSAYGSFQGSAVSGRVIVLTSRFSF